MLIVRAEGRQHDESVQQVVQHLISSGCDQPLLCEFGQSTALLVVGGGPGVLLDELRQLPGVQSAVSTESAYPLVSRETHPDASVVTVGNVTIGQEEAPVVIAGPCSVETRSCLFETAEAVKAAGAHLLRGGAFKPRTNPYSFQGLGEEGLRLLREAGQQVDMPTVTEVVAPEDVELVARYADVLQIGARNMANFRLLRAVGRSKKPVLLKRGIAATVEEWLQAAEYILAEGNDQVILCERGVRSFEPATRNMLDLAGAVLARQLTHLPVLIDPSHATGIPSLIAPMSAAAIAAGTDGITVEVHPAPEEAWSDGAQALTPQMFEGLMESVHSIAAAVGRPLAGVDTTKRRAIVNM